MNFAKHHYKILIKEGHLDTFGHMNNATYLQLLEEARWDFISSKGFGLKKIHETGLGPIILEISMKFAKEIRLRQNITIESEVLSYEKKISKLRQDMLNEKGEVMFQSVFTFGLFDTRERKLVMPTQEWLVAVGAI